MKSNHDLEIQDCKQMFGISDHQTREQQKAYQSKIQPSITSQSIAIQRSTVGFVGILLRCTQNRQYDTKEEQQAKAFNNEIDQFRKPKSGSENSSAAQKRSEIEKQISNVQQAVHATESLARWQKKMEHIQILAGKRNIANTYVWDADGGMHSESQQFANTIEHMIGGSFSHDGAAGGEGGFKALGTGFELTALVTANLTQTMSKTETRSKAFELNVDVSGVESTGITDYNDHPIQPGEKVDRYRFMSFYLEGSTENFNSFFNEVVDPEWLASNDEEARALRQARGKANKTWRVFHRVTYVERPALMGFGRDIRSLTKEEEMPDNRKLQAQIEELKANNEELTIKIDRILSILNPDAISDSGGNG